MLAVITLIAFRSTRGSGSAVSPWQEIMTAMQARGYTECRSLDPGLGASLASYICSRADAPQLGFAASIYVGSPEEVRSYVTAGVALGEAGCLLYKEGQSWAMWNLYGDTPGERDQLRGDLEALDTSSQNCRP